MISRSCAGHVRSGEKEIPRAGHVLKVMWDPCSRLVLVLQNLRGLVLISGKGHVLVCAAGQVRFRKEGHLMFLSSGPAVCHKSSHVSVLIDDTLKLLLNPVM